MLEKPKTPLFLIPVLLILGLVIMGLGLWMLVSEAQLGSSAERALATVEERSEDPSEAGRRTPPGAAYVRFQMGHQAVQARIGTFFWSRYREGEKVPILYTAGNAASARLDSFWLRYWLPILLLLVSILPFSLLIMQLVRRHRYSKDVAERDQISPLLWKMRS